MAGKKKPTKHAHWAPVVAPGQRYICRDGSEVVIHHDHEDWAYVCVGYFTKSKNKFALESFWYWTTEGRYLHAPGKIHAWDLVKSIGPVNHGKKTPDL